MEDGSSPSDSKTRPRTDECVKKQKTSRNSSSKALQYVCAERGDERMTEQIAAVQRMQDFIAAHLDEKITPMELARGDVFAVAFLPAVQGSDRADTAGLHSSPAAGAFGYETEKRRLPHCRRGVRAWLRQRGRLHARVRARIRPYARLLRKAPGSRHAVCSLRRKISSAEKGI